MMASTFILIILTAATYPILITATTSQIDRHKNPSSFLLSSSKQSFTVIRTATKPSASAKIFLPKHTAMSGSYKYYMNPSSHQIEFTTSSLYNIRRVVNARTLSTKDRRRIIKSVRIMFSQLNPNLPLQRNLLTPRANILKKIDEFERTAMKAKPFNFHNGMVRVFNYVDDGHTAYIPPFPLRSSYAALGFFINSYWRNANTRVFLFESTWDSLPLVNNVFKVGVEILKVDGIPIQDEVERVGRLGRSRRPGEDRVLSGMFHLTFRNLGTTELPKKVSSTFTYKDLNSVVRNITVPWVYITPISTSFLSSDTAAEAPFANISQTADDLISLQPSTEFRKRRPNLLEIRMDPAARHFLHSKTKPNVIKPVHVKYKPQHVSLHDFSKHFGDLHKKILNRQEDQSVTIRSKLIPISERFESLLYALKFNIITGSRSFQFGYLQLSSFSMEFPSDTLRFISELKNITSELPKDHLILDIRDNPGGFSPNVYLVYSLLHGKPKIPPPTFALRATRLSSYIMKGELTELIVKQYMKTGDYLTSNHGDILFGSVFFSQITIPRIFNGQAILLTNSQTSSAGDAYAGLCKDTGINPKTNLPRIPIVGTDPSTNGAGASTVSVEDIIDLIKYSSSGGIQLDPLFNITGLDISISTAFLRFNRAYGQIVEHFGVRADVWYRYTKRDILQGSLDLVFNLASLLQVI